MKGESNDMTQATSSLFLGKTKKRGIHLRSIFYMQAEAAARCPDRLPRNLLSCWRDEHHGVGCFLHGELRNHAGRD